MAETPMMGAPGGGMGRAADAFLNRTGSGVDKLIAKVQRLEQLLSKVSNALNRTGAGGTPASGNNAGNILAGSMGNVPAVPGAATGSPASFPSFSSASFGMSKGGLIGSIVGGTLLRGGLGMLAAGTAMIPTAEEGMTEQSLLHNIGIRNNSYNGIASQQQLESAIRAANPFNMQIGGKFATRQAALTMAYAGMPVNTNQNSMFMRNLGQGVGLAMLTGSDHATMAQAQVGMYSGPTASRMTMFGMPVRNLGTGNMKSTQQVLDTMWNRMSMGPGARNGITAREVQQSYLSGWLGSNLNTLGLSQDQQQMVVQYFTAKARNNGQSVNLRNPKTLDRLGFNEINDTRLSQAKTDDYRAQALSKSFVALNTGVREANNLIQKLYQVTLPAFDTALGQLAIKLKAKGETLMNEPESQPLMSAGGGMLTGLLGGLGTAWSMRSLRKFLTKGKPPGVPGVPGVGGNNPLSLRPAPSSWQNAIRNLGIKNGPTSALKGSSLFSKLAKSLPLRILGKISGPLSVGLAAWDLEQRNESNMTALRDPNSGTANRIRALLGLGLDGPLAVALPGGAATGQALSQSMPIMEKEINWVRSILTGGDSPVPGRAVIGTPWRQKGGWGKGYHPGIDIRASTGTPVLAALDGKVIRSGPDGDWGNAIHVRQSDGTVATYAHLSKILVSNGDRVDTGTMIGKSGYSGRVIPSGPAGAHLHFEVRKGLGYNTKDLNPVPYVRGDGQVTGRGAAGGGGGGATGRAVVEYAKKFIGTPYVAGGRSPKGWDCAGFTWYVYKHFGKDIGQVSEAQLKHGSPVRGVGAAAPGDIFVWRRKGTKGIGADGHVAIYVGGGKVIHSHGGTGGTTNITPLSAAVPGDHYLAGIRRIVTGTVGKGGKATGGDTGTANPQAGGLQPYAPMSVDVGSDGMQVSTSTVADYMSGNGLSGGATAASTGTASAAKGDKTKSDTGRMGIGAAVGASNKAKVWNMLIGAGFSAAATAGIIGNLQQESGIDPNSNQGGGGPGRGIMQWTNTERWASLKSWANKRDLSARSLSTQVEYMLKELRDAGLYNQMRNINDVEKATDFFQYKMERAGEPNMPARYKYAREALRQFGKGSYSEGAYNIAADEDARVHAGEMILTSSQAEAVRKSMAETLSGIKGGNHTWNIYPPAGTSEDQIRHIVNEVKRRLSSDSTTKSLMEV